MSFSHGAPAQSSLARHSCGAISAPDSRRAFLRAAGIAVAGSLASGGLIAQGDPAKRQFKLCLTPGSIGVQATQMEAIELAVKYGFEAVEPYSGFLASDKSNLDVIRKQMSEGGLSWGASSLSVDFRKDTSLFRQGVAGLPRLAKALSKFGAPLVGTWISASHASLTYLDNFRQHASRLREVAQILKDHGLRLGLEYVGTHTLLVRNKYPFIHTMAETRNLISEIGTGNVGLVLDSWHWWQAEDSAEDIQSLRSDEIISVDLNDAPAGIEKRVQLDNQRELASATGVIPLESFLKALVRTGYVGPVRAEPFNKILNDMPNEPALEATARAMKKAIAIVS